MDAARIKNNDTIPFQSVPRLEYGSFLDLNAISLAKKPSCHCVNYYGLALEGKILLICCMAEDESQEVFVSSSLVDPKNPIPSFTHHHLCFEKFEREIHEHFGIPYTDHPWLKPVRYPVDRKDPKNTIANYPFFGRPEKGFHEVGVGPIHAGIIEPGHFRFVCAGEQVVHLEIQLGYQHRGLERLFLERTSLLQRATLAENIAGDTVAGHSTAFINLWESSCGFESGPELRFIRTLALELERMAIHVGDLGALCTDIAYQLGSAVFGRLRTPLINFFQTWCGNRLAKGLLRPGKNHYPFTDELAGQLLQALNRFEPDFLEIAEKLFRLRSARARFESTGAVDAKDLSAIGVVGMTARMHGLARDIRWSHPHDAYPSLQHRPVFCTGGDVFSRAMLRRMEIEQSLGYLRQLLTNLPPPATTHGILQKPGESTFTLSMVEGWRGEICHAAITGSQGELLHYKIKDPSFHNWLALGLALRNNEISDFPICNKSFDLSYCGHDL